MGHPAPDPSTVSLCIGGGIDEAMRVSAIPVPAERLDVGQV
jgi:hypothetical protein